jgi:hypothetical protein
MLMFQDFYGLRIVSVSIPITDEHFKYFKSISLRTDADFLRSNKVQ